MYAYFIFGLCFEVIPSHNKILKFNQIILTLDKDDEKIVYYETSIQTFPFLSKVHLLNTLDLNRIQI